MAAAAPGPIAAIAINQLVTISRIQKGMSTSTITMMKGRSESSSSSPSMIFVTDQTKQLKVKYTSVAEHKRQRRFELNIPKIFKPQILKIEKTVVRSVKVVCEDGPVLEKHMVESEYIEVQEETEVERLRAELAIRDRILTKIAMGSPAKAKVKAKPSKRPTKSIV